MSRQEKPNQQSKGINVRRGGALLAAMLVAATVLATVALSSPATGMHQAAQDDEVQIVLSSASGFTPTEVTHASGMFALAVENQDVTSEYVLQLKGEGGVLLNEIRVQKGSTAWTVDLPPGVYTLMVANHPDWLCQITVQ